MLLRGNSEPGPSTLALFHMLMQISPVGLLGPIRCCLCQPAASLTRAADGLLLKEQLSAAGMATKIASHISQEIVWRSPCDLFQTCARCQYLQKGPSRPSINSALSEGATGAAQDSGIGMTAMLLTQTAVLSCACTLYSPGGNP